MSARIKDLLSFKGTAVYSIERNARVADAVRVMRVHRVGCVPVLDGGVLCGIVSEGDILRRVVGEHRDPYETGVEEIMTTTLRTVSPGMLVHDAMALATESRCRHLPVVDGDRVLGVVSGGDFNAWMVRELRLEIVDLIGYINGTASEPPPPRHERISSRAESSRADGG